MPPKSCSAVPSHATPRAQTHGHRHRHTTEIAATGITSTHFVLPFDSTFGPLKPRPSRPNLHSVASKGEQTLGALTVNGPLHLTQTSPAAISGLLAGYGRRTPQSLRDLINFQNLPSRTHFNPISLARSGISMKVKEQRPSPCGSPKGGGLTLSSCCRTGGLFPTKRANLPVPV
jgi:hypothetical protein